MIKTNIEALSDDERAAYQESMNEEPSKGAVKLARDLLFNSGGTYCSQTFRALATAFVQECGDDTDGPGVAETVKLFAECARRIAIIESQVV